MTINSRTSTGEESAVTDVQTSSRPRIDPVPAAERTGELRALLDSLTPAPAPGQPARPDRNLPCTVVKHADLFPHWAGLGRGLQTGTLPWRDRELVTLRVAFLAGSAYEWAHHSRSARRAGITSDEIERIQRDVDAGGWDPVTAAKIRTVEEIKRDNEISQQTWEVISTDYTEQQLIELLLLQGFYWMTASILKSLRIEVDGWLAEQP
jgi:4-carboxymuconolactone decarboxylase